MTAPKLRVVHSRDEVAALEPDEPLARALAIVVQHANRKAA